MLSEALSYPTEDDDWTRPFLIGSGLIFASFLVGITIIPIYGYYLRVLDAGRTGDRRLPQFDDWESLIVDGIKVWAVNFVYAGIPGLVFLGAGFFTFLAVFAGGYNESGGFVLAALVVGGAITLLAGLLWLAGTVIAPAALAHMRAEGEFGAAFDVRTLVGFVTVSEYLIAILLAWVVVGVISVVGSLLVFLLVGIPIVFFAGLVSFHLFGQGYQAAREQKLGPGGGTPAQQPTA
jgi:hypothetical protein